MAFTFREDGYFNMTKAAAHFGKRVDNFMANAETEDYIRALNDLVPDIPVTKTQCGRGSLPQVGTWAHPKLAIFFARWLNTRFSVWCDSIIEDILSGNAELTITKPEKSATVQASTLPGVQDVMLVSQHTFLGDSPCHPIS